MTTKATGTPRPPEVRAAISEGMKRAWATSPSRRSTRERVDADDARIREELPATIHEAVARTGMDLGHVSRRIGVMYRAGVLARRSVSNRRGFGRAWEYYTPKAGT